MRSFNTLIAHPSSLALTVLISESESLSLLLLTLCLLSSLVIGRELVFLGTRLWNMSRAERASSSGGGVLSIFLPLGMVWLLFPLYLLRILLNGSLVLTVCAAFALLILIVGLVAVIYAPKKTAELLSRHQVQIWAIMAILLLVAAVFGRWPYGFYTFLRLFVCGTSAYLAFVTFAAKSRVWPWLMGGLAVLFNPLVPIHLHRTSWQFWDALAAILLLIFILVFK